MSDALPIWMLHLLLGDGRPAPYGLLSAPMPADRMTRQRLRWIARQAAKGTG